MDRNCTIIRERIYEMKMQDLAIASIALQKLSCQDLSIKTLYKLTTLFDRLEPDFNFLQTQKFQLLNAYCEKKGAEYIPIPSKAQEFDEKLTELMNIDLDIGNISLPVEIPFDENIKLSYKDLKELSKFIKIKIGDSDGNRNTDSGS